LLYFKDKLKNLNFYTILLIKPQVKRPPARSPLRAKIIHPRQSKSQAQNPRSEAFFENPVIVESL
jgi:hypothetical protein